MTNKRLEQMKAGLVDVQTEEERQTFDEYCNNIYAEVPRAGQLKHLSETEVYDHIRSLRDIARKYQIMQDEKIALADMIIDGWIALDDAASKDQNLSDDWDAFLITMKLMEK